MIKITQNQWNQFLTENRINPDKWCDYIPEDYGYTLIKEEVSKGDILLKYFHLWKDNWLSGNTLIAKLEQIFPNERIAPAELRTIIKDLRLSGNIIIAGNKGYMLTNDLELIGKYVKSRWGELTREMKVLKAIDKSANGINLWTIEETENK